MQVYYHTIYLSPHLDDVALSCGSQIFSQTTAGESALIVTVMAGDPPSDMLSVYAHSLHSRWQLAAEAVAARRQEDVAACRVLGADHLHWDVPDCIYRHHPTTGEPLYLSDPDIFGEIHEAEVGLINQLAALIATLPKYDRLVVPLAVGHHVDHQLVRLAAEQSQVDDNFRYYEDFPYAQSTGALEAVFPTREGAWLQEVIPITEAALSARIEAVASFESQLSTFFNGRADLSHQITKYVRRIGGERLWYR